MKKLFVLLTLGALAVLLLAGAASSALSRLNGPSWAELERERLAVERAQAVAPVETFAAQALALAPVVVVYVGLLLLAAWGSAAVWRVFRERRPDSAGRLPVPVALLPELGASSLGAYHLTQLEAARRPNVPHSLNYHAPHYRGELGGNALPALAEPAAVVPSFGELLSAGRIGPGQPLCLGVDLDEGAPIWGDWRDLYSAGLGGKQGSGKSWTAASLIAQSLLGGARVIIGDPHSGDAESLLTRLGPLLPHCELIAEEPATILEAARYAQDEFKRRRLAAQEKRPHDRRPVILVIDEWTSLLRGGMAATLPDILSDLTQEGRKYGVNALLLAQRWEAAAAGGSDVRNTLTAHYAHRMRGDELRMMTGMRAAALPGDPLELQPGQSYLFDTRGNVRKVATPLMNESDLGRVAAMLAGGAAAPAASGAPASGKIIGFRPRLVGGAAEGANGGADAAPLRGQQDAEKLTPEEARVVAAFLDGKSPSDLAAELAGGKKSGDAYAQAARRVADILRRALGPLRAQGV